MKDVNRNCSGLLATGLLSLSLLGNEVLANAYGVTSLEIEATDDPPVYEMGQIEQEVADSISRTNRNLQIRVAMLGASTGGSSDANCNAPDAFAGLALFCEVGVAVANSIESAVERRQAQQAIEREQQSAISSDPALAPDLALSVDQLLATNLMQLRLADAIGHVVAEETDIGIVNSGGSSPAEHRLTVRLTQVEAVGSRANPRVAIRLRGAVVLTRVDDGTVIATHEYVTQTPEHLIEEWSQGGIQLLADGFSDALSELAEVLAEETLLTVTSPRQKRSGYLLEPIAPLNKVCLSCDFRTLKNYGYREVDTLTPTFEWESFEAQYAEDPLVPDADVSAIDVTYDLRLFRARDARILGEILVAGDLLEEFRGIDSTSFSPGVGLSRCAPYLWTVRARFKIDGHTYLTHWSGNFKEKDIEDYRRKRIAESGGAAASRAFTGFMLSVDQNTYWQEGSYYFPFLPNDSADECTEAEILQALNAPAGQAP